VTASVFCCCKILLGINGIYHKFVSNQESLIPQYLRSWLCGLKSCYLLIQFYLKGTLIYAYNVLSIAKRELQTRTTEEVSPIGFLAKKIKTHNQTSKYREVKRELLYYKQAYIWFSFWEPQINTKRKERLPYTGYVTLVLVAILQGCYYGILLVWELSQVHHRGSSFSFRYLRSMQYHLLI